MVEVIFYWLLLRKPGEEFESATVQSLLELAEMDHVSSNMVNELSTGQKKRLQTCCAIVKSYYFIRREFKTSYVVRWQCGFQNLCFLTNVYLH